MRWGPFFFGAVDPLERAPASTHTDPRVLIIRLRRVPFIDITGLQSLRSSAARTNGACACCWREPKLAWKPSEKKRALPMLVGRENVFKAFSQAIATCRQLSKTARDGQGQNGCPQRQRGIEATDQPRSARLDYVLTCGRRPIAYVRSGARFSSGLSRRAVTGNRGCIDEFCEHLLTPACLDHLLGFGLTGRHWRFTRQRLAGALAGEEHRNTAYDTGRHEEKSGYEVAAGGGD